MWYTPHPIIRETVALQRFPRLHQSCEGKSGKISETVAPQGIPGSTKLNVPHAYHMEKYTCVVLSKKNLLDHLFSGDRGGSFLHVTSSARSGLQSASATRGTRPWWPAARRLWRLPAAQLCRCRWPCDTCWTGSDWRRSRRTGRGTWP